MKKPRSLFSRFVEKIRFEDGDSCWEWTATSFTNGYGAIRQGGSGTKMLRAHRAAWEFEYEPIPEGLHVLHRCDNKLCVRPSHLFLGTHDDNMADKVAKGRQFRPRGELQGNSKLTASDIPVIRRRFAAGERQKDIAKDLNVTQQTISDIVIGRRWVHLKEKQS